MQRFAPLSSIGMRETGEPSASSASGGVPSDGIDDTHENPRASGREVIAQPHGTSLNFSNVFVPSFLRATRRDGNGPYHGWLDVLLASLGQAAAMSGFGVVVATLAIATSSVTGNKAVGTFSLTLEFLSRAVVSIPASGLSTRVGRRPVLVMSAMCGVCGALLITLDLYVESYVLAIAGIVGIGVANGVSQQLRFVAAEAVDSRRKKRALAFGVAGGVVAAFTGPEIAIATRTAFDKEFVGCFIAMSGCYALLAVFSLFVRTAGKRVESNENDESKESTRVDSANDDSTNSSSLLHSSRTSANARKGLVCTTATWTAMFLIMSAAPLAMTESNEGNYSFKESTAALQLHLLCMFAPGLFGTGDLVRVLGGDAVACLGIGLFIFCSFGTYVLVPDATQKGDTLPYYAFREVLIVLGIAWHLVFVASSSFLQTEKRKTQGAAESFAFFATALVAACSGALLQAIGWRGLNVLCAPINVLLALYLMYERFGFMSERKENVVIV